MPNSLLRRPRNRIRRLALRLRLVIERARLAAGIREYSGVTDVPHDIGDRAREIVAHLARRQRALTRILH